MNIVKGGVTAPAGFLASGVSCGIKKRGKDLSLIFSEKPAKVAGAVTQNALKAPCVLWAQKLLKKGSARGIVANSGNANCCTGRRGARDNEAMARLAAAGLGIDSTQVAVASTGVIGRFLPMIQVRHGIHEAIQGLSKTGSVLAAEGIMTTDTRPKEIAVRFFIGGKPVTIGGIAKGSGMVAPNMATMLAFLTTDADVESNAMQRILRDAVEESFNAITVDGEMSTNDMVILLANGASKTKKIRPGARGMRDFQEAVRQVCRHLAHEIVRDGEGVTRVMKVQVTGAATKPDAQKVARQVGNSLLVKTMVAGRDPNWGRVAAAVGAAGVSFHPDKLVIHLGQTAVFRNGEPTRLQRETLLKEVDQAEVQITVHLNAGSAHAGLLSGDLTEEYIRINAKYTT